MALEDLNEKILEEIDRKEEKSVDVFLNLMLLEFISMTSLFDYINITNSINIQFQQFANLYSQEVKSIMIDEILRINPFASQSKINEIINNAFLKQYSVKGSTSKVNLNEIIFRRSEKMKNDLYLQINARGYEQLSKSEIERIKNKVLKSNKKGIAQIASNEVHKIQNQSSIDRELLKGVEKMEKIFEYKTQRDKRVRSSHAFYEGEILTAVEAQKLQGGVMSEINCRCYFVPI